MAQPEALQRLLPDDLARARSADESFHAAVGMDDRAIAEMRRDWRAAADDGCRRKGLPRTTKRHDLLEEVAHGQ